MSRKWTTALVFLFLAFLACPILTAENAAPQQAPITIEIPPTPQLKQQDRKGGHDASAAMAAAAAGMQALMCMKMMQDAQKEEDPKTKQEMMMMAMMMCKQAADSAKNAADNKDKGQELAKTDSPPTKITIPPTKLPDAPKEEEVAKAEPTPQYTPIVVPDFSTPEKEKVEKEKETRELPTPEPKELVEIGKKSLEPIDVAKLFYDPSGKAGQNPTPNRELGIGASVLTKGTTASDKLTDLNTQNAVAATLDKLGQNKRGIVDSESAEASSAGATSGKAEGGGGNPFEGMMGLLGGSPGAEVLSSPGGNVFQNGLASSQNQGMNIFQIATHEYHRAAFQTGSLRTNRPTQSNTIQTGHAYASKE